MKRAIPFFLLLTLLVTTTACGAATSQATNAADSAPQDASAGGFAEKFEMEEAALDTADSDAGESGSFLPVSETDYASKMIYTAEATVQTLAFDEAVEQVSALTTEYGGFIQSSSVTGRDYYASSRKYTTYRNATFVLRIPSERFSGIEDALSSIGNVTYFTADTENITTRYYDTQGRLSTYRTEEERLLAMLEKCETVEDMITIESRLSEVRYEIESLTTTLNSYDQQVAYSTITLYLNEVAELTEEEPVVRSYWQQIGDGFVDSLQSIGHFFKALFKAILCGIPYLAVLAAVAAILIPLIRKLRRRRKAKRSAQENKAEPPREDR